MKNEEVIITEEVLLTEQLRAESPRHEYFQEKLIFQEPQNNVGLGEKLFKIRN